MLKTSEQSMATAPIDADQQCLLAPAAEAAFPWIVFDMDGTLVDSFGLILESFNYAAGRFMRKPLNIEEALSIPGGTLEEQLANYVPLSFVPQAIERYHAHYADHFSAEALVFPGIRLLLSALYEREVKLAVCTGADRESARYTLSRSGLSRFFQTLVTGNDVIKPKPDPEGLMIAMEALNARPDHTIYLGDHPNDVRASQDAGAKPAAACWGSMDRNELRTVKPQFFFKNPFEALCQFLRPQLNRDQLSACVHLFAHGDINNEFSC
jgi:HAD superfamily hydrolase (TIGR01509 family)